MPTSVSRYDEAQGDVISLDSCLATTQNNNVSVQSKIDTSSVLPSDMQEYKTKQINLFHEPSLTKHGLLSLALEEECSTIFFTWF